MFFLKACSYQSISIKNSFQFTLMLALLVMSQIVMAAEPLEGTHYRKIDVPITSYGFLEEKELVEFFSFACYHCYKFEQELKRWNSHGDISVKKVPVSFGRKSWKGFTRFYLVLEHLALEHDLVDKIFDDIHEKGHRKFDLKGITSRLNLSAENINSIETLFNSAVIDKKVKESNEILKHFSISGVPAMLIKGTYLSNAAMARGTKGLALVSKYLMNY